MYPYPIFWACMSHCYRLIPLQDFNASPNLATNPLPLQPGSCLFRINCEVLCSQPSLGKLFHIQLQSSLTCWSVGLDFSPRVKIGSGSAQITSFFFWSKKDSAAGCACKGVAMDALTKSQIEETFFICGLSNIHSIL